MINAKGVNVLILAVVLAMLVSSSIGSLSLPSFFQSDNNKAPLLTTVVIQKVMKWLD
ncbi:MAG: hypothetical protein ACD_7C00490G0005 [uncultured bacterium]|nr:MAG: hypothetical protein ACD_7C00490G0005 [uncultured bacterium]